MIAVFDFQLIVLIRSGSIKKWRVNPPYSYSVLVILPWFQYTFVYLLHPLIEC